MVNILDYKFSTFPWMKLKLNIINNLIFFRCESLNKHQRSFLEFISISELWRIYSFHYNNLSTLFFNLLEEICDICLYLFLYLKTNLIFDLNLKLVKLNIHMLIQIFVNYLAYIF